MARFHFPLEGVALIYMFAVYYFFPVYFQFVQYRVCHDKYGEHAHDDDTTKNATSCDNSQVHVGGRNAISPARMSFRIQISGETAQWINNLNFAGMIPTIVVLAIFGAASDVIGRKPLMFMSAFGNIVQLAGLTVCAYYNTSLNILYVTIVSGFTGGYSLFLMTLFASMADKFSQTTRTIRINFLEGCVYSGICLGGFLCGLFVSDIGYASTFFLSMMAYAFCGFCVLFVEETHPKQSRTKSFKWYSGFQSLYMLWSIRPLRTYSVFFFFKLCIYLGQGSLGLVVIAYLYDFSPFTTSCFVALDLLTRCLCLVVVVPFVIKPLLKRGRITELTCIRISVVADIAYMLVFGFGRSRYLLFANTGSFHLHCYLHSLLYFPVCRIFFLKVCCLNCFLFWIILAILVFLLSSRSFSHLFSALGLLSGMAVPMTRSIMSRHVSQEQQGSLFGGLSVLEALGSLAGTAVMNGIYSATVNVSPSIVYGVVAGVELLLLIPLALSLLPAHEPSKSLNADSPTPTTPLLLPD
eukprot:m.366776 g.366776  ORF g.366776 m.366776 type:complete len:523 (-) comp56069_c1_seq30:107-1675(-)